MEKNPRITLAANMPSYAVGDPITFTQYLNIPINLFGLRKQLEKYNCEELYMQVYRVGNVHFTLGIDMKQCNVHSVDEFYKLMGNKLKVEPTMDAIANKINSIMMRHYIK